MRMKSSLFAMGLVAAAAAASTNVAQAQAIATISASATVATALTAANVQNLAFGTVIPTFAKNVATTDATNAGIVRLNGANGAGVNISLSNLVALSDGLGHTLAITYSAGTATTQTGTQSSFAPATGTATFLDASTGQLFVFLGGSITAPSNQTSGAYNNTVTVTASYNGNCVSRPGSMPRWLRRAIFTAHHPAARREDRVEGSARRLVSCAATFAALAASQVGMALAQGHGNKPLTNTGSQTLAFGTVFPGLRHAVLRTDAVNSGQFQIRGQNGGQVTVTFTLPAAMTGPGGSQLPLTFGANDGGYSQSPTISAATGFDPRTPLVTTLSGQGRLYLYLGGAVSPPSRITPGAYSATITCTVIY